MHCLDLPNPIPAELRDEFLKRICYVSEELESYDFAPDSLQRFEFALRPGNTERYQKLELVIQEFASKLTRGYRPIGDKIIGTTTGSGRFTEDPHPALIERGELFIYGRGRAGLGPEMHRLIDIFESEFRALAQQFDAQPNQYPALIGADVMDRCRYLRSFPSSLTFVSHLREDAVATQAFIDQAQLKGGNLNCDHGNLSAVECLLSPNICFHCYSRLQGKKLEAPLAVTATGKCFRYESKNLQGLERLWDFTMREVIFLGPMEHVLRERERSIELMLGLMKRWDLSGEIRTACDPFFTNDFAAMTSYQKAFDLKFELLLPLPYKNKTLAVGSFNYHQDFFGRSFEITHKAAPVHTACAGFGLERLLLAFLAQHGPDRHNWPAQFQ